MLASVIALIAGMASPLPAQPAPRTPQLSIVEAEKCPVRVQAAALEPGSATGLRVRYTVSNTQGTKVVHLVVTAATVSSDERVTAVRVQTVDASIEPRGRSEQYVVFPKLTPSVGERVVFGVQAVGWSDGREWRGVVRLASGAEPKVPRD